MNGKGMETASLCDIFLMRPLCSGRDVPPQIQGGRRWSDLFAIRLNLWKTAAVQHTEHAYFRAGAFVDMNPFDISSNAAWIFPATSGPTELISP